MLEAAVILYILVSCFIAFYSFSQLVLVVYAKRYTEPQKIAIEQWPKVLIQLPIFNELNVVEDLLTAVNQIDYPKELLTIQVLDDSNDATTQTIKSWLKNNSLKHDFQLINRENRSGFKAGALSYGLQITDCDFVAIFDADFLPNPDFLKAALPLFSSDNIGVVQTKWAYSNQNESLLTQLQAFGLHAHFQMEQKGRSALGAFLNFNGTAGIWRKSCIEQAGGWHFDSLTEDLDLSYRAQLMGYKIVYSNTIESPSLLPNTMLDVKNQQFRWTKGAAQCTQLHLKSVWQSKRLTLLQKLISTFHLGNALVFPAVLLASILSFSAVYYKANFFSGGPITSLLISASALVLAFMVLALFYFEAHKAELGSTRKAILHLANYYFMFLSFTMALSVKNTRAVLEGILMKQSDFVRTPKQKQMGNKANYSKKILSSSFYIEVLLLLVYSTFLGYAIFVVNLSFVLYYSLLVYGFAAMVLQQVKAK